jgi:hypothetical protein
LRLDGDQIPASPQLPPLDVKRVVLERVDHRDLKRVSRRPGGKKSGKSKELAKPIAKLWRGASGITEVTGRSRPIASDRRTP